MSIPPHSSLRIIIVENDNENKSGSVVEEFSQYNSLHINYYLETSQGLSHARNRAVREAKDSDFCCFVDDDQEVSPDWLLQLFRCQTDFNADAVWGPNPPVFSRKVPAYIEKFHAPDLFGYGEIVRKAHTNCLLVRKECLDKLDGPFDERLNYTGGEDSYMTSVLSDMGCIIRFNPDAVAYEIIPEERTSVKYVIRRTFRISNAGLVVKSFQKDSFSRTKEFGHLLLRFGYGLLILVPYMLFSKRDRLRGVIKIANAAGGFSFIFGSYNKFYK
jgi:succinoglycan biosynthesis protein ExoM